MNDLRILTANIFALFRSRQADVIATAMMRWAASDSELTKVAPCSVKPLREWCPTAHRHRLVYRDKDGTRFTVRLKQPSKIDRGVT